MALFVLMGKTTTEQSEKNSVRNRVRAKKKQSEPGPLSLMNEKKQSEKNSVRNRVRAKKKQSELGPLSLPALTLFLYPEWDLNPHGHCCPQDFKSCVSTDFTIRA
jgi:hypothetical protein